jgi:uncharacterized protein (DUF3084 family)
MKHISNTTAVECPLTLPTLWCLPDNTGSLLKSTLLSHSSSNSSSSPSGLTADLRALANQLTTSLSRHQQHAGCLSSQLSACQAAQQQLQQQAAGSEAQGAQLQQQLAGSEAQVRELRECLAASEASKQTAVQAAVAQTEARYGRKMIKVEAKVLGMVSRHYI